MKCLLFCVVTVLFIQASLADGGDVSTKTCDDYLGQTTCDKLRKVAQLLNEKATIVQEAVNDAIAKQKTKASEMLAFIKGYIAERFPCENVLTPEICQNIFDLGKRVHLTAQHVRLAIENAVANGATTVKTIYSKAVNFMKTEITCEKIFSQQACDNIRDVMKKFNEQVGLLSEAIMLGAQKQITNAAEMMKFVKNYLVEKVVNFKCENVLPQDKCQAIRDIATNLRLTSQQVKRAIEKAVISGVGSVIDVYNKTLDFLTNDINCANILGQQACDNLVQAAKKLREQTILIKEAIMAAAKKQITNAADILKSIKDKLVSMAVNFQCTDVLPEFQCNQIKRVATSFKIKTTELKRVLIEAVVNGSATAKQIYDKTIGGLIEDAKNLKCEDLIPKDTCDKLDAIATKFRVKISEVTVAVKQAIADGKDIATGLVTFVKEYLKEKISCDKVLGTSFCDKIEKLTSLFQVSFKRVTEKLRELIANGVTSVYELYTKILTIIRDLFTGRISKRSAVDTVRDDILKKIMDLITRVLKVGKDMRYEIREKVKALLASGKSKFLAILKYVRELIAKKQSNDDDVAVFRRSIVDDLKEKLKKVHGKVKVFIESLLKKIKEALKGLTQGVSGAQVVSGAQFDTVSDVMEDMTYKVVEDEVKMAEKQIEALVAKDL